ncbi:DMT family transporter [Pleurocapsa sp. FMAR1]|uniref:DMT family transporter n=1 Tax=Pleurocapsa sp. FMAR1 TaxID=3040204 RepID=UPI0029C98F8B|nr:DMT family transporter [Pleurocapsa sp. FMAR1]
MTKSQSIVRGAFFIVASELSFAFSAAIIKLASASLPNESIVFFRNLFGLVILTPLLIKAGRKILHTDCLHLHLVRGGFGMAAMYSFFYALGKIPLGNSMLIKSTIPLIIPFVSLIWLKESITRRIIIAGVLGFLGVFLILDPNGDTDWASLVALGSSFMAAIAFVTVRKLSATEPPLRIVAYFAIFGICISAIPLTWAWQTPTPEEYLMLLGVALTTTIGQLLLTRGYQNAPASSVGIFTYSSVPFGTFLGWLYFEEILDINSFFGAILIILAGFIILRTKVIQEQPNN